MSDLLTQYQATGLHPPIRIRAGFRAWLLTVLGAPALVAASMYAMVAGEFTEQILGLIGVAFFGFGFLVLVFALTRATKRGLCEINKRGLYLAHLDYEFPWDDIGPAWVNITRHAGGTTAEVIYPLKNVSTHQAKVGRLGRLLLTASRRIANSSKHGMLNWGLSTLMTLAEASSTTEKDLERVLETARKVAQEDQDSILFNIPAIVNRQDCEALAAIINAQIVGQT